MGPKKAKKEVSKWLPLPENASGIMQSTHVHGLDDLTIRPEDMSMQDLEYCSTFIDQSNKTLEVENAVIERYLQRMDPVLIAKMDSILDAAAAALHKAERTAQLGAAASALSVSITSRKPGTEESLSTTSRTTTGKTFSQSAIGNKLQALSMADNHKTPLDGNHIPRNGLELPHGGRKSSEWNIDLLEGPRVQPAHKIEIINREIDELRNTLETFREKARKYNYLMRCKNEELSTRLQEIVEARQAFEQKVVIDGVDPLLGKVPAEKLVRFLEIKVQAEDSLVEKIRMKIQTVRNQLKRLKQQLIQKEELGEVLHAVDFEQLQIENKDCQDKLDEKILHLIAVKRINGRCGNMLNSSKKKLHEQMTILSKLQTEVHRKEGMIDLLLEDEIKVNKELTAASREVDKISDLMKTFTAPEAIEYIKQKAKLHDLKKSVKVWDRRLKLKELALSSQSKHKRRPSPIRINPRAFNFSTTQVPLLFM